VEPLYEIANRGIADSLQLAINEFCHSVLIHGAFLLEFPGLAKPEAQGAL
jgi:hypothetical protein